MSSSDPAAAAPETARLSNGQARLVAAGLAAALLVGIVVAVEVYGSGDWAGAARAAGATLSDRAFWIAAAVGLFAQVVDGALGMAYGVTSTSFLLAAGVPPAAASASVHVAEIFTTGFSGLSHWRLGNVGRALFRRLLLPGMAGAVGGAYLLTNVAGDTLKPWITAYLLVMGLSILIKAFGTVRLRRKPPTYVAPLALAGGFVDAVGGGGWGPVVTTSLVGGGQDPRTTIGSVNAAEFFVAVTSGLSLTLLGGLTAVTTIAGLVIGGLFAAPFAALLVRALPPRALMITVGLLIVGLSAFNLLMLLR